MPQISAGLLMYRFSPDLEVFLIHHGGPFWTNKDDGAWFIPKGLVKENESIEAAAIREFHEETGLSPSGEFIPLGSIKLKSGKTIYTWAFPGNVSSSKEFKSNLTRIEWPYNSGKFITIPEVDQWKFFSLEEARVKIHAPQQDFLDRLADHLKVKSIVQKKLI